MPSGLSIASVITAGPLPGASGQDSPASGDAAVLSKTLTAQHAAES
jgi:hypothetical protein